MGANLPEEIQFWREFAQIGAFCGRPLSGGIVPCQRPLVPDWSRGQSGTIVKRCYPSPRRSGCLGAGPTPLNHELAKVQAGRADAVFRRLLQNIVALNPATADSAATSTINKGSIKCSRNPGFSRRQQFSAFRPVWRMIFSAGWSAQRQVPLSRMRPVSTRLPVLSSVAQSARPAISIQRPVNHSARFLGRKMTLNRRGGDFSSAAVLLSKDHS